MAALVAGASVFTFGLTGARGQTNDTQTQATDQTQAANQTQATNQTQAADQAQTTTVTTTVPITPLNSWDVTPLYNGVSVRSLMDAEVKNASGENVGEIESVVVGADGNVRGIIVEGGGFLEIGDSEIFVPWADVTVGADPDDVRIPVIADDPGEISRYSLFSDEALPRPIAGQRAFRASEVIGDYVRLQSGTGYGYVRDMIVDRATGALQSVVVVPDVRYARGGYYAYPFHGYGYGFDPGLDYYALPYGEAELAELKPFDYDRFDD